MFMSRPDPIRSDSGTPVFIPMGGDRECGRRPSGRLVYGRHETRETNGDGRGGAAIGASAAAGDVFGPTRPVGVDTWITDTSVGGREAARPFGGDPPGQRIPVGFVVAGDGRHAVSGGCATNRRPPRGGHRVTRARGRTRGSTPPVYETSTADTRSVTVVASDSNTVLVGIDSRGRGTVRPALVRGLSAHRCS